MSLKPVKIRLIQKDDGTKFTIEVDGKPLAFPGLVQNVKFEIGAAQMVPVVSLSFVPGPNADIELEGDAADVLSKQIGADKQKEIEALMDSWKSMFGDPKDPDVQARIDNTVKLLTSPKQATKAKVKSDTAGGNDRGPLIVVLAVVGALVMMAMTAIICSYLAKA